MPATLEAPTSEPVYQVGQSSTPARPLPDHVRGALAKAAGENPAPAPEPKPTPEPSKQVQEAPKATPEVKAPEAPKPTEQPQVPKEPKELRLALESAQARLKELEESGTATKKQLEAAAAKEQQLLQELETYKPLKSRLEEVEKEKLTYEEKLRVIDYTQHPEFHERYVKPVSDALQNAHLVVKDFVVVDAQGQRLGTEQDFQSVLAAPNGTDATRRAKALFGDDPTIIGQVLAERNKVLAAERTRQKAFETAALESAKAMERQKQQLAEYQASMKSQYEQTAKDLLEKDGTLYKPDPADKEAFAAYEQGAAIADEIVRGNPAKSQQDYVRDVALIRHRAASYPVAQLKIQRLTAEVSKLQEQLKAFQRSEPSTEGAQRLPSGDSQPNDPMARARMTLQQIANKKG